MKKQIIFSEIQHFYYFLPRVLHKIFLFRALHYLFIMGRNLLITSLPKYLSAIDWFTSLVWDPAKRFCQSRCLGAVIWRWSIRNMFLKFRLFFHNKSSRPEVFCKKGVLKIFAKFPWKHLWQSASFLIKLQAAHATLLKNRVWRRYFPLNFAKVLRTSFL